MTPLEFLGLTLVLCAVARGASLVVRARHVRAVGALSAQRGFQYVQGDVLGIGARLADRFPVVGAADLVVSDLVYRREAQGHRYVFTAHYTLGVVRLKRRIGRVATFTEPRDAPPHAPPGRVELAPGELPLLEQYGRLLANAPE